jgi:hypothetical protein
MPDEANCIVCKRNTQQAPLLSIQYQGEIYWICPQHLPVLIHTPEQLAEKLPGVENLPHPEEHQH